MKIRYLLFEQQDSIQDVLLEVVLKVRGVAEIDDSQILKSGRLPKWIQDVIDEGLKKGYLLKREEID